MKKDPLVERVKAYLVERAKVVFGDDYSRLAEDKHFAFRCLNDSDAQKRGIALSLLRRRFKKEDPDFMVSICLKLIDVDESESVVRGAITAIGSLREGTFDEDLSKQLAKFVHDENRSEKNRCVAFGAIVRIRSPARSFHRDKMLCQQVEQVKSNLAAIKERTNWRWNATLDQIDWPLVNELAKDP